MIRFRIDAPRGGSKVLSAMQKDAEARIKKGVDRAAIRVTNEIKKELSKGGSAGALRSLKIRGRVRIYPKNETAHLRVITGKLRASWKALAASRAGAFIQAHVITNNPYSRIHEYGGPAGSRFGRFIMRARPYVRPALKTTQPKLAEDMIEAYIAPIRKA